MGINIDNYVDVATRIAEFREKCPEGRLRPVNPDQPYRIETIGNETFITYTAACYRTPDDPMPGIGVAQELFPGKTPYTRGSEIQNAETSAWGRAIVAALQADTRKGVASSEEVRNRQADRDAEEAEAFRPRPVEPTPEQVAEFDLAAKEIAACESDPGMRKLWADIVQRGNVGRLHASHGPVLIEARNAQLVEINGRAA